MRLSIITYIIYNNIYLRIPKIDDLENVINLAVTGKSFHK